MSFFEVCDENDPQETFCIVEANTAMEAIARWTAEMELEIGIDPDECDPTATQLDFKNGVAWAGWRHR